MKDQISISRVLLLHPKFRASAQAFIEDAENTLGITLRIVQGLRTFAEQDALYAQGRTAPGNIVTYSKAGTSYHNFGIALDVVPVNADGTMNWNYNFENLRPFAVKQGMQLGLDFPHKDSDHFENKYGFNWRWLLHLYETKQFIAGTNYVIL
jgi:hypothetical protein